MAPNTHPQLISAETNTVSIWPWQMYVPTAYAPASAQIFGTLEEKSYGMTQGISELKNDFMVRKGALKNAHIYMT